ncbi:MAG: NADH-quinone oxidoreductase subunit NuoE [Rhodobacteraceae bacterium]|nr:NADH-quinone oxidoreductase subunit NuoE [Alphaproteobacteria bacterium]MBT8474142.1 NADH-quinone oxidoreductase subunit NuoE [Alphaproteobacteria bacterium]NNK65417.1 NADH-quinone oxidoreductase subunit NuoE [Paracoccaceae bacterium]
MLRRLHPTQPDSFAFTPANQAWAEAQITKYPEGRQASAIIPLLWRAQEQEGWLTRPAIETVADMLGLAYIRALEVASFYFMFQLQPVGSVANIQVCGTTSCMICGAEDLVAVCKDKIAPKPHTLSADGKFSWEEVECLGACANAPMAQIGKDYYEDLTAERLGEIIDELAAGKVPTPGPQTGRYAAEPASGLTSLTEYAAGRAPLNASATLATEIGDTVKRIDGTEVPLIAPWQGKGRRPATPPQDPEPIVTPEPDRAEEAGHPVEGSVAPEAPETAPDRPAALETAREGGADDLKKIKGVGPKLEKLLNSLGFYHFDQIAGWTESEVAWVDENLEGFKGRVSRDEWVAQAKILATGGETEFSQRVKST